MTSKILFGSLFAVVLGLMTYFGNQVSQKDREIEALKSSAIPVVKQAEEVALTPEQQDTELAKLVILLMDQTGAEMSPARKQIVVQTVVRVTGNVFNVHQHREHFAVLLAIESRFNNKARSKVGATGIAQVMPRYASEFAKICGIDDYKKSDLLDLELNMTIGACQFRALLEAPAINGNVAAALVGYNAGKHSASFRNLLRQRNIKHPEPPNYVARFTFLSEEVKKLSEKITAELEKEEIAANAKKTKVKKKK